MLVIEGASRHGSCETCVRIYQQDIIKKINNGEILSN